MINCLTKNLAIVQGQSHTIMLQQSAKATLELFAGKTGLFETAIRHLSGVLEEGDVLTFKAQTPSLATFKVDGESHDYPAFIGECKRGDVTMPVKVAVTAFTNRLAIAVEGTATIPDDQDGCVRIDISNMRARFAEAKVGVVIEDNVAIPALLGDYTCTVVKAKAYKACYRPNAQSLKGTHACRCELSTDPFAYSK